MRKIALALLLLGVLAAGYKIVLGGTSPYSYTQEMYVTPVSQADGDTFQTFQVSLTSGTQALIDAVEPQAQSLLGNGTTIFYDLNRSYRKRTITNISTFILYIGTNTNTLNTTGFELLPSTGPGNYYTTYDRGAIYGQCDNSAGTNGCKVSLIKETNSVP